MESAGHAVHVFVNGKFSGNFSLISSNDDQLIELVNATHIKLPRS